MIKHGVLAVRLFANIMAGHTVVAVILGFIMDVANSPLYFVVAPASVLGQVGVGLLELFVAFLRRTYCVSGDCLSTSVRIDPVMRFGQI